MRAHELIRICSVVAATTLLATASHAEGKKKGKKEDATNFDDLFGAPPTTKNPLEELQKATSNIEVKSNTGDLAPRSGKVDEEAQVKLHAVFAAERIVMDKERGCQPAPPSRKRVVEWTFNEVPQEGQPFQVCLTLSSSIGREMNMSVSIADPRNYKIAKAEDVIDFRGRTARLDHVLEFPAPLFKMAGQYQYVVELDGREVGRLPIFVVKVQPEGATTTP